MSEIKTSSLSRLALCHPLLSLEHPPVSWARERFLDYSTRAGNMSYNSQWALPHGFWDRLLLRRNVSPLVKKVCVIEGLRCRLKRGTRDWFLSTGPATLLNVPSEADRGKEEGNRSIRDPN